MRSFSPATVGLNRASELRDPWAAPGANGGSTSAGHREADLNVGYALAVLVFRSGSLTPAAMTPRPKDTDGLSCYEDEALVPGTGKINVRVIDTERLPKALGCFHDGAGHVSIAPRDENGALDAEALKQWAAARNASEPHEFTRGVLDAIVGNRVLEKEEK